MIGRGRARSLLLRNLGKNHFSSLLEGAPAPALAIVLGQTSENLFSFAYRPSPFSLISTLPSPEFCRIPEFRRIPEFMGFRRIPAFRWNPESRRTPEFRRSPEFGSIPEFCRIREFGGIREFRIPQNSCSIHELGEFC